MRTDTHRAGRSRRRLSRLLAAAWLALAAPEARAISSEFFGNPQGLEIQPELNVYHHVGGDFRVLLKLEPSFTPSESYSEMGLSVYAAWFVAPLVRNLVSPDVAKSRRLDVRAGAGYLATVQAGTVGWSRMLQAEAEATPRFVLPLEILLSNRNRFEARWQLADGATYSYRLRARLQLEREFDLSGRTPTSLTPFANAEVIWSSTQDMWSQFRVQAGLQLGVHWFGKGQVLEANASILTYLQPSRSYAPVLGLVWSQYF